MKRGESCQSFLRSFVESNKSCCCQPYSVMVVLTSSGVVATTLISNPFLSQPSRFKFGAWLACGDRLVAGSLNTSVKITALYLPSLRIVDFRAVAIQYSRLYCRGTTTTTATVQYWYSRLHSFCTRRSLLLPLLTITTTSSTNTRVLRVNFELEISSYFTIRFLKQTSTSSKPCSTAALTAVIFYVLRRMDH